MKLLKNKVGRPSNEFKKRKNILKVSIFLFVLVICLILSYSLSKISTKKLNGAVIASTTDVAQSSEILIDPTQYEPYGLFTKGENYYLILSKDDNYYISNASDEINENNLKEIEGLEENDSFCFDIIKETKDGGIIIPGRYKSYKYDENFNFEWKITEPEADVTSTEEYIYIPKGDNGNVVTLSKYDYEGNPIKDISYTWNNKTSVELSYMFCDNDYLYLIVNDKNSDDEILVKFTSDTTTEDLILNASTLNIEESNYEEIDIYLYDDNYNLSVSNGKIGIYYGIEYQETSSSDWVISLKELVINADNLEVENIYDIETEEDGLIPNGEDEINDFYVLNIDYGDNYDLIFNYTMIGNGCSSSSGSSSGTCEAKIGMAKIDKQGNVLDSRSLNVQDFVDDNEELMGNPGSISNKLLFPIITENEFILRIYEYTTKNGVNVEDATGGTVAVSTSGSTFKSGTKINFTVTPNNGYELKSIKILDKDNQDVTANVNLDLTNNSFDMPDYGVVINAEFEAISSDVSSSSSSSQVDNSTVSDDSDNPYTYDDVVKYIIVGAISIVIVGLSVVLVIKNKKK